MNMLHEERDRILQLIEAGQISAEQGARLLDALNAERPTERRARNRLVSVQVTDLRTNRQKVNVTIPVSLINVGLRLGARLAPTLSGSALEEFMHAIERGASGRLLEWQDLEEGERIEIFVE